MALADDLKDLRADLQRLVKIVEGLLAQAEAQEHAALSRIGAPPRMTRKA